MRSKIAEQADLHLAVLPGTDVLLTGTWVASPVAQNPGYFCVSASDTSIVKMNVRPLKKGGVDKCQNYQMFDNYLGFAERHREVIRRFGRFPHRNAALGRSNTPEEQAWLDAGGGF